MPGSPFSGIVQQSGALIPRPGGGPPLINPTYRDPTVATSPQVFGAGMGGTPSIGQMADNPFQNTFNFQIPTASGDSGSASTSPTSAPGTNGGSGYGQYLPLIVIGVITAGIAYYAFGRKK